jgi:hypothetical protein
MAVITKEELMEQLKTFIGDNKSDEVLSFVENVSDTYDELHNKASGDGVDWKEKYEKNDAEWRQRYTDRFFSGTSDGANDGTKVDTGVKKPEPDDEPDDEPERLKFDDLFSQDNGKE